MNRMQHICVVEDESSLSEIIRLNLEMENYRVSVINDGGAAKELFKKDLNFDLVILDVMLPYVNGVDLCKFIRERSNIPILFLSAKGTTEDRIKGLKAGGNDYLPKPFDLEEFLLRVSILLQMPKMNVSEEFIAIGDKIVNFKTYVVTNNSTEEKFNLSKKEVQLIQLFNEKRNEAVSRNEILDRIWGKDQFPTTRTIDNFILNFRKIFEENPREPRYFHSIRGVGYKFTP
jgi:two-component system, OmpR family, alkaline phosphatase synthesis response regulator PhoP